MNAAYSASSSGRPSLPAEVQKSCIWSKRSGSAWARSVSKIPAAIALTLTPNVAASRDRHFGETDHGGFRRRVVDRSRQRAHRADGSDVENHSLPLPDHLLVYRLRYGEQTVDVCVDHFVPRAIGGSSEVVATVDGGVVDENVDPAPLFDELSRHFLHARRGRRPRLSR